MSRLAAMLAVCAAAFVAPAPAAAHYVDGVYRHDVTSCAQVEGDCSPGGSSGIGTSSIADVPSSSTAQCESGGDPTAVSPDGTYRGKWQFDQSTWEAHGGSGDPAAAPEAEQDRVAARVSYDAWPNC